MTGASIIALRISRKMLVKMKIKQLIPKMLLVAGLVLTILVSGPSRVLSTDQEIKLPQPHTEALTDDKGNVIGTKTTTVGAAGTKTTKLDFNVGPLAGTTQTYKQDINGKQISGYTKYPDGSSSLGVFDGKGGVTSVTTDKSGVATTENRDSAGNVVSKSIQSTSPNGTVATQTIDPATGKVTQTTLKDSQGNVTTQTPDGKGGLTQRTTDFKTGNVTFKTADGTSTVTDKNGVLISKTTVKPDGKGGFTSVTTDNNGKVISKTTTGPDGKIVSQKGKNNKFSVDTGAQSTGGMQTSQGKGKHKDKQHFQSEVVQQNKEKLQNQNMSSSSASSGSSGQMQYHRRR
jgi:hypothetical protein